MVSVSSKLCIPSRTLIVVCILLLVAIMCVPLEAEAGRDFYKVLGIKRTANAKDIKRAYRKLSRKYHPDKNPGDETATSKFAEVANAYEALSDEEKRAVYDQRGEEGLQELAKNQAGGGGGGFDPFDMFFGGGRRRQQQEEDDDEPKGPDINMDIFVTLRDAYVGRQYEISHKKQSLCINWQECQTKAKDCVGAGRKRVTRQVGPGFIQQVEQQDSSCVARGWRLKGGRCTACPKGLTEVTERPFIIEVEPGSSDGDVLVIEGQADETIGHRPGDVHFKTRILPHQLFIREGLNLRMTFHISLLESLVGFEHTIEHLDGHKVTIKSKNNGVTPAGKVLRVRGEGMPTKGNQRRRGDLLVSIVVDFPKSLTEEQRAGIATVFA
jgi:DnaJ-related protein SCJ1